MGQDDQDGQGPDPVEIAADEIFETLKAQDVRNERRIFRREVMILIVTALLVTVYLIALWLTTGALTVPLL